MPNGTPSRWMQWRVKLVTTPMPDSGSEFVRRHAAAEEPGPDGIRRGLVDRIRREIEAGTYDTEERWLAAEERLLQAVEQMS